MKLWQWSLQLGSSFLKVSYLFILLFVYEMGMVLAFVFERMCKWMLFLFLWLFHDFSIPSLHNGSIFSFFVWVGESITNNFHSFHNLNDRKRLNCYALLFVPYHNPLLGIFGLKKPTGNFSCHFSSSYLWLTGHLFVFTLASYIWKAKTPSLSSFV